MKSRDQAYVVIAQQLPLDEKIMQRLDRAKNDVLGYGYDVMATEVNPFGRMVYRVSKASTTLLEDNGHTYTVSNTSCNCPDYETARGGLCKHRLAIMILEEMERE
jgi:hypothetical protein